MTVASIQRVLTTAACLIGLAAAAFAQTPAEPPQPAMPQTDSPLPDKPPANKAPAPELPAGKAAAERQVRIDQTLDQLKTAPNEQTASVLEEQLTRMWLRAGTPAVTLLMSRGLRALQAGQSDDAIESFSDAITLQPDAAEAWHQRAIARYHAGDAGGAIRDLEQTVQLEPRDFAAFHTLADIAQAREDWKGAYAAWQKVMELDPMTPGGEDRLKMLKRKAVGEDT